MRIAVHILAAHVDRLKDITDDLPLLLLVLDAEVPERVRERLEDGERRV